MSEAALVPSDPKHVPHDILGASPPGHSSLAPRQRVGGRLLLLDSETGYRRCAVVWDPQLINLGYQIHIGSGAAGPPLNKLGSNSSSGITCCIVSKLRATLHPSLGEP